MTSFRALAFAISFVITCCLVRLVTFNIEVSHLVKSHLSSVYLLRTDTQIRTKASGRVRTSGLQRAVSRDSKCLDEDVDWSTAVKPKYEMDSTRFLIPTLFNGPNNQMLGFQQSVLLSLLLNRTLVLPVFYHHEINKFFRTAIPVEYRLNVQKLREYISVVPLRRAVDSCHSKFDAIFAKTPLTITKRDLTHLLRISVETGFRGIEFVDDVGDEELSAIRDYLYSKEDSAKEKFRDRKWWPKSKNDQSWMRRIQKQDGWRSIPILPINSTTKDVMEARSIYSTDAKCALHLFPFRHFDFSIPQNFKITDVGDTDLSALSAKKDGWKFLVDVVLNTQPPNTIFAWSKRFRDQYLCNTACNYLSIHWRFDKEDFFGYLCKNGLRKNFCDSVKKATDPSAIAKAILTKVAYIYRTSHIPIGAVYIAAPPTLDDLLQGIVSMLTNLAFVQKILPSTLPMPKTFTFKQLKDFILLRYNDCKMASPTQLSDTISQVEMDICSRSYAFFWSRQSTWSSNAKRTRSLIGLDNLADSSVVEVVLNVMEEES